MNSVSKLALSGVVTLGVFSGVSFAKTQKFGVLNSSGVFHESCKFAFGRAFVHINSYMMRASLESEVMGWHVHAWKVEAQKVHLRTSMQRAKFKSFLNQSWVANVNQESVFSVDSVMFNFERVTFMPESDVQALDALGPVMLSVMRGKSGQRLGAFLSLPGRALTCENG